MHVMSLSECRDIFDDAEDATMRDLAAEVGAPYARLLRECESGAAADMTVGQYCRRLIGADV